MNQQLSNCSRSQLWSLLAEASDQASSEDAFLEGSRDREKSYSKVSLVRWHEIIQIILKINDRGTCLDIGTTALTLVLPRFFREVHTLDFTENMRSRCERAGVVLHSGGLSAQNGKVVAPVPDATFDCILFLEVIEHLHLNPVDLLRALHAKLKPGGTLLLSTPNMMTLGNRIRMALNRRLHHFHYPPFAENEHPQHGHRHDRIFMPAELKDYFAQTGWSTFKVGYHGMEVLDLLPITGLKSLLVRLVHWPLKGLFPSLRQLILVEATK